jgi:hypothetical protein
MLVVQVLLAVINTAAGTGFFNLNFAEQRQGGFKVLPNPDSKIFTGRVFQTFNIVEVVMIQLLVKWLEGGFEVTEIHNPALVRRYLTTDI